MSPSSNSVWEIVIQPFPNSCSIMGKMGRNIKINNIDSKIYHVPRLLGHPVQYSLDDIQMLCNNLPFSRVITERPFEFV